MSPKSETEVAVLGGGCFWCTEALFRQLRGVGSVTPGYAGGTMSSPAYSDVGGGQTGHAEVIRVEFDPKVIAYREILDVFWHTHDPTTINRQGADVGEQYRSLILYTSEKQRQEAEKLKEKIKKEFDQPIVTQIKKLDKFWEAEDYHHDYYEKNKHEPYCRLVISPKLEHLRKKYSDKLKKEG